MQELPRRKPVFERRQVGSIQQRFGDLLSLARDPSEPIRAGHVMAVNLKNSRLFETFGVLVGTASTNRPTSGYGTRRTTRWSSRKTFSGAAQTARRWTPSHAGCATRFRRRYDPTFSCDYLDLRHDGFALPVGTENL